MRNLGATDEECRAMRDRSGDAVALSIGVSSHPDAPDTVTVRAGS